jgi:hypothetical protein
MRFQVTRRCCPPKSRACFNPSGGNSIELYLNVSDAYPMTNLLDLAISCDDSDRAANIIDEALGIESDYVVNYCFPKDWPTDREVRARIIGGWLQAEAQYLA